MGCEAGLKEKVNLMRNVSAWLLRVFAGKVMNCSTCLANYCEKFAGKVVNFAKCLANYCEKFAEKVETAN